MNEPVTTDERRYTIDLIPGDGIGQEVVPAATRCVDRLGLNHGFRIDWRERSWGRSTTSRIGG
jgi:tartrate dehydrogenase/decarboxylase/D-malate dehydrogenase